MDDQIPADKVREVRDLHRDAAKMATITDAEREIHQHVADAMEALLLTPPTLPTMADMTDEERHACLWMQCDVAGRRGQWVIAVQCDADGEVGVVSAGGGISWFLPNSITPRPDLPRLEWPGDKKPADQKAAPALPGRWRFADHPDHGRVVVTKPTPDSDGRVYVVRPSVGPLGCDCYFCTPDELTYIDQDGDQ